MKLSILVPVFNEEKTILSVLKRLHETKISDTDYEIIVINDGSTDNTKTLLENNSDLYNLLINNTAEYLMFDWFPIEVFDPEIEEFEEKPLLKEITRSISNAVNFLILFLRDLLLGGVNTIVSFSSWDWVRENKWAYWPALPWTVVSGGAIILGYNLQGKGLAVLVAISSIYIFLGWTL